MINRVIPSFFVIDMIDPTRGKIIRGGSSRLFSLGLRVENEERGGKSGKKEVGNGRKWGRKKEGRCREGMVNEKGAKEEEERGERSGRRRGEVKQHAQWLVE